MSDEVSKKIGDLLVIQMAGVLLEFIAEVIDEDPLLLKVQEHGPYAKLNSRDYIILEDKSLLLQNDDTHQELLRSSAERGHPLVSGLKVLGVTDGNLHKILPIDIPSVAARN